jgi:hypothetical protein
MNPILGTSMPGVHGTPYTGNCGDIKKKKKLGNVVNST